MQWWWWQLLSYIFTNLTMNTWQLSELQIQHSTNVINISVHKRLVKTHQCLNVTKTHLLIQCSNWFAPVCIHANKISIDFPFIVFWVFKTLNQESKYNRYILGETLIDTWYHPVTSQNMIKGLFMVYRMFSKNQIWIDFTIYLCILHRLQGPAGKHNIKHWFSDVSVSIRADNNHSGWIHN